MSTIVWKRSGPTRPSTLPSRGCCTRFFIRMTHESGGGHAGRPVLEDAAGRSAVAPGRKRVDRRGAARAARGGSRPGPDTQPRLGGPGAEALDRPIDTFLEYGLWLTARQLAPDLAARGPGRPVRFRRPAGAPDLRAARPLIRRKIVKPLLALLRSGQGSRRTQDESVQTLIARLGEPADLAVMLDLVIAGQRLPAPRRRFAFEHARLAPREIARSFRPGDLARIGTLCGERRRRVA